MKSMTINAKRNRMMFFGGTILGVIVIFIFSIILFGAPQARAYAIGSEPAPASQAPTTNSGASSYDAGSSLQNLISPFTGFINDLKWNNNTTINTGSQAPALPTVNLTPVVAGTIQNILSQWLSEFNNWFYGLTGVELSGILLVLLNAISWTLNLAQQVVNWLLGLFHQ
jgi:phage-related protein